MISLPLPTPRWFLLGRTYKTLNGDLVKIVDEQRIGTTGVEHYCVQGSDGAWRYDRPGITERGRVTGTSGQDLRNLIAGDVHPAG